MTKIASILKSLRGDKTLTTVAKEIGITPQALANYEAGIRVPRDQVKVMIAKYYGVSVESIFFAN